MSDTHPEDFVMSYFRVRQALGLLGLTLPVNLLVAGQLAAGRLEPSISDFFHTTQRDIFVGTLSAIGVFLIVYRGHRRAPGETVSDDWVSTVAGLAALVVAFFPNEHPSEQISTLSQVAMGVHPAAIVHYAAATVFQLALAYLCFFKFARTSHQRRRHVYRALGLTIVAAMLATMILSYLKVLGASEQQAFVLDNRLVFWSEAIGVWAFSLAWLVKGSANRKVGV
ncbi:MAG: hypothetical protein ACWA47_06650 [Brevirhabdus sp.]